MRIKKLLKDIDRNGYKGIGHPEPLHQVFLFARENDVLIANPCNDKNESVWKL